MRNTARQLWKRLSKEPNPFVATGQSNFARDPFEFLHELRAVIEILDLKKTDALLDIGCGPGLYLIPLSPLAKSIVGVDFADTFVKIAKKNTKNCPNVKVQKGDLRHLTFSSNSFDKILVGSVLHYVQDEKEEIFKALRRVLKPTGRIFMTMIPDKRMHKYYNPAEHIEPKELLKLARQTGFRGSIVPVPKEVWQSCYMFSMVLDTPQ